MTSPPTTTSKHLENNIERSQDEMMMATIPYAKEIFERKMWSASAISYFFFLYKNWHIHNNELNLPIFVFLPSSKSIMCLSIYLNIQCKATRHNNSNICAQGKLKRLSLDTWYLIACIKVYKETNCIKHKHKLDPGVYEVHIIINTIKMHIECENLAV